jgi:hypothetical protein
LFLSATIEAKNAHMSTRSISDRAGGEYPAREHDGASMAGADVDENAALLVDRSADGRVNGARRDDADARVPDLRGNGREWCSVKCSHTPKIIKRSAGQKRRGGTSCSSNNESSTPINGAVEK